MVVVVLEEKEKKGSDGPEKASSSATASVFGARWCWVLAAGI